MKYEYKVNFSAVAHICRVFLHLNTEKNPVDVIDLLCKELVPVRNERQYSRLKTAYFRCTYKHRQIGYRNSYICHRANNSYHLISLYEYITVFLKKMILKVML